MGGQSVISICCQVSVFRSPSSASLSIEVLHGFSAGNNSLRMSYVPTTNPFKAVPPMSDENNSDNPYQPPALSDEPLVKKDADGPKAKPHPANWWVAWLGYGYIPFSICLTFISQDPLGLAFFHIEALPLLIPVYGLVLLGLTVSRLQKGTNSVGLTLFQVLSIAPPILWGLFNLYAISLL